MPRNLLPRLRQAPNPANIPQLGVGEWQTVSSPPDLAKLDYGNAEGSAPRTRLQSVPSPWARMLLFRNALAEDTHPARKLVENEILDALEFLWSAASIAGGALNIESVRIADLNAISQRVGSERVENLAEALVDLVPTRDGRYPAFDALTIVTVDDRPVLGTSPYTLLFTAEDAAGSGTSDFFKFKSTGADRPLAARQRAFQQYVASVIVPQLDAARPADAVDFDWTELRRLVGGWLQRQVRAAGLLADGTDWRSAAERLKLTSLASPFAGVQLYGRSENVSDVDSRWRIRPSRTVVGPAPLLLDRSRFDGVYYEGATAVTLPSDLRPLDRSVLPVTGVRHPWVDPSTDWFSSRLVLLDEPLKLDAVLGLRNYVAGGSSGQSSAARLALPLTPAFFTLFRPEDLDKMLRVSVDGDRVECTLRIPVGDVDKREIEISRVYTLASTAQAPGPSLTIWPRFTDPRWHSYLVFRCDAAQETASLFALSALGENGERLNGERERRNSVVETTAYSVAPAVVAIHDATTNDALGVLLPRYTTPARSTGRQLDVGIDFGTSNTVISLREEGVQTPELLKLSDAVLSLTQPSETTSRAIAAYFFPKDVEPRPFGTAAVYLRTLGELQLERNGLGVRVNVPFDGEVEPDPRNTVVGDLKWSTDKESGFLTEAFLRHILALVLAHAIDAGFEPANVRIRYAYPRAFSERQRAQLDELWKRVWTTFARSNQSLGAMRDPIDESQAMLHHFYNAGVAGVAGDTTALLDIGGGTSDIAVYRRGEALVLDSLMLGGRNLTGQRFQGADAIDLRNAFVRELVTWAEANNLTNYPAERRAVKAYMDAGQDHLAFTYLLRTKWYEANGYRFTGARVAHQFQGTVLYLFGALFYYLGLTAREVQQRLSIEAMPRKIVLAGNGSRYISWLTGGGLSADSVFLRFFAGLVRAGAGIKDTEAAQPIVIELSRLPKEEVARGLVGQTDPILGYGSTSRTPLVGEAISLPRVGQTASVDRIAETVSFDHADIQALSWQSGEMEIERFHAVLLEAAAPLMTADPHWSATIHELGGILRSLRGDAIQNATRERVDYVATTAGGFRGSLFAAEVATVLDLVSNSLFPKPTAGTRPAAPAVAV